MSQREKIIKNTTIASFILIGCVIFSTILIFLQLLFLEKKPENFGVIGDAVGGISNPIISIGAALLTFLAFYIQKQANDELKTQFETQRSEQHNDFIFNSHKEKVMLIINEVNNFNVSFHDSTLISNLNLINARNKKYNFSGVQGISLFLIEYSRDKKEKEKTSTKEFKINDTFHAIMLQINNLVITFCHIHNSICNSKLNDDYLNELQILLSYTYYTKINYIFEIYLTEKLCNNDLEQRITRVKEYYQINKSF